MLFWFNICSLLLLFAVLIVLTILWKMHKGEENIMGMNDVRTRNMVLGSVAASLIISIGLTVLVNAALNHQYH